MNRLAFWGWRKLVVVTLLIVALLGAVTGGPCKPGHGYPPFCPQFGDPSNHTRCCRHYYTPRCCEERANHVCVRSRHGSRSTSNHDPSPSDKVVFCPQPGQPDDYKVCCTSGSTMKCCSTKLLAGILGGVFGGILLIGIIIGIVCCVLVHRGICVCVRVRPGKWTMVSQQRAQAIRQQNERHLAAQTGTTQPNLQATSPVYGTPAQVHGDNSPTKYSNPDYTSPPPAYSPRY